MKIKPAETLEQKTVILELTTKRYGNRGAVATEDLVDAAIEMDKSMVSIRKRLLDSKELLVIKNFDQETYRYIQKRALKSNLRPGFYRLPLELFKDTEEWLKIRAQERAALVAEFVKAYPTLQEEAVAKLGKIYRKEEYPSTAMVEAAFFFDWEYQATALPKNIKTVDPEAYGLMEAKADITAQKELEAMRHELRTGLAQLVAKFVERLEDEQAESGEVKAKSFKATTLENFAQFLDLFDARNLSSDTATAGVVAKCRAALKGVDAGTLRDNPAMRAELKAAMAEADKSVAKLVGPELHRAIHTTIRKHAAKKPNRKIKVLD